MNSTVFIAVLAAAVMHASWNVLVKLKLDRFLSLFLIQSVMTLMGVAMLLWFPWPSQNSLPYAITSGLLHLGYNLFLARSYRTGDLSQVYPIARGLAPLLTLAASWLLVNENPGLMGAAGITVLVLGIWMVTYIGRRQVRIDGATLFFAVGTSVFIAAYTLVDGLGGRASGSPSGYAGLVFIFDGTLLSAAALIVRGPAVFAQVLPFWKSGLAGGVLAASGYWIVIWAMSEAPIAAVAALRETSILIVILLSVRVLKESVSAPRVVGAALIVAGAVLIRLA